MRKKLFELLARLGELHSWKVILVGLLICIISFSILAIKPLSLEMKIMDLVPKDEPSAQEFDEIIRQYSSASQIMVGIEGESKKEMIAFADQLEARAKEVKYHDANKKEYSYVKRVTARGDMDFLSNHGMMITKKKDLQNLEELYQDLEMAPFMTAYNDFLEREYIEDSGSVTEREKEDRAIDGLKSLMTWLGGIEQVDKGNDALNAYSDNAINNLTVGNPYMFSDDDSMLLVLITPSVSMDELFYTKEGVIGLQQLIAELKGDRELNVRMAGMPVLAIEEEQVGMEDMGASTLVSLVLVLTLFIVAFRMWTAPLLATITLVMGIILTAAFIALTFGRVNLMTMMFAVILIGLGIDFAVHLNAAFSTARAEGKSVGDSLRAMYAKSGSGVITGALTTAAAFFALALTGLDALVELGVVLGAGIIFTMLVAMTILPAMYAVHSKIGGGKSSKKPVRLAFPFLEKIGEFVAKRPWPVVAGFVIICSGFVWVGQKAQYEPDMLEMEPADMPSVTLHRDILKKFELNPDYSMVTSASLEETRPIVKKMKKNRLVGRVDAITEYIPSQKEQTKRAKVAKRIANHMLEILEPNITVGLPGGPIINPPVYSKVDETQSKQLLEELDRLQMNLLELGAMATTGVKIRLERTCNRLSGGENPKFSMVLGLKERLSKMDNLETKMAAYQQSYVPILASKLEKMSNTENIKMETIPENIRDRYMSDEGNNLVTIYSAVDVWQGDKAELFIKATSKASARVTGTVVMMDRLISLIGSKGSMATFLSLGAVFIILLVDFRSLGYALLGMMPLLSGFVIMIGAFVLLGKKFDVSNLMAIPLILGIGIDDAVHVLHAIKRNGVEAMPKILKHTGRALVLTSLTTSIAFGSIAFASHRGLAGMGQLLVLGVVACLITSLVLLPALARIFLSNKTSKETNPKEARNV